MNRSGPKAEPQLRPANPVHKATFLSSLTFWWLRDLFRTGLRRPIETNDIFGCLPQHGSAELSEPFSVLWTEEKRFASKPSLLRVLRRVYMPKFFAYGVAVMLLDMLTK